MDTSQENMAFIVVRGIIALAIVGMGFYCVKQGISFFMLPRVEAEQIHIHLMGLDITASGLGAVIFSTGLALCFVGKQTVPQRIQNDHFTQKPLAPAATVHSIEPVVSPEMDTTRDTSKLYAPADATPPQYPTYTDTADRVTIMEGKPTSPMRFD